MPAIDVAVVGAGPAGLSAAVTAAELGLQVILLDERPVPGGQYVSTSEKAGRHWMSSTERQSRALLSRIANAPVDWRPETLVWHLAGDLTLDIFSTGAVERVAANAVILATGAREYVVPFPGWTLPGVMTAGAAQLLAKRHDLVPGQRILLAGSGPLLLPAAVSLAERGGQVQGVMESSHPLSWLKHSFALWGNWDRLGEARHYLGALLKARIPYHFGHMVIAARGSEHLESVLLARIDRHGHKLTEAHQTVAVDTLCVGSGLVPNVELARLAGVTLRYNPAQGGWVPPVDERMQTEVPGIFVVGEAAGIKGAAAALIEGRLAALGAALRLGRLSIDEVKRERARATQRLSRAYRFGAMVNTLFTPPPAAYKTIADDTPVCRCEEVTAGQVRAAISAGAVTLDALKTRTRLGQGHCQGRTCAPLLARLVTDQTGLSPAQAGLFTTRPPVKPVPLSALVGGR